MIFVDTSALIALGNKRDQFHDLAVQAFQHHTLAGRSFITTNAVIMELMNAFSVARFKPIALMVVEQLLQSAQWEVVFVDQVLMRRGIERFQQRQNKDWGLVDCISMLVAEDRKIYEVLTNDHHFAQGGFTCLLK